MVESSIVFTPEIPDRAIKREVRKVNDALEDAGTINPEIGRTGGLGGGGGMASSGPRSPLRRVSRGVDDLVPMADYRNRLLEDILDATQAQGGGGGFLGGIFGKLGRLFRGGNLLKLLGGGAVALAGIIAAKLNPVNLAKLLGDKIGDVLPKDLVDPVELTASALIKSPLAITAGMLIASKAVIGAGDVIADKATVVAEDLWEQATESGTSPSDTTPDPEGKRIPTNAEEQLRDSFMVTDGESDPITNDIADSLGQISPKMVLGAVGAGAVGAGVAATAPISVPAAVGATGLGALGLGALSGGAAGQRPAQTGTTFEQSDMTMRPTVNVNPTFQIDPSGMSDLQRQIEQGLDRVKQEALSEVERNLSSGRTGRRGP